MSSTTAYDAVFGFLSDTFGRSYAVLNIDDIESAIEQYTDPFLVLESVTSSQALTAFGDPCGLCHRETGVMVVHGFTPAPESSRAARAIADTIADAVRLQVINGVRVTSVSPPDIELTNEGLWSAAAVALSYEYDTQYARPGG